MSLVFGHANPVLQKVLLELCFSEEAAIAAFRQPRLTSLDQALDDDVLSGEQLRVLPLLYRSVPIDGMSTESITKVVGMYKHTFCRNSLMLSRLEKVQAAFGQADFEPMIGLKGLPALAYLNEGLGARPMADVDILIPRLHERPEQTLAILDRLGYTFKGNGFRSVTMLSPELFELDLHWYVQDWALGQDLVDVVRQRASVQAFGAQVFLIPCVEHHLAHTIAHGVLTKTLTYDARWVFDAVTVLMRSKAIDVNLFAEFANCVAAPQRIRDGLSSIAKELPGSIRIDRKLLGELHEAVVTNSKTVSWLYNQTPTPNLPPEQLGNPPRIDRIKAMLISYVWLPRYLRKRHGLSFLSYFRWLQGFPPLTYQQAFWCFVKKVFLRGPRFLCRVISQK